jgi:hypothetical protein
MSHLEVMITDVVWTFLLFGSVFTLAALVLWIGWGLSPWYSIHHLRAEREAWPSMSHTVPWVVEQSYRRWDRIEATVMTLGYLLVCVGSVALGLVLS